MVLDLEDVSNKTTADFPHFTETLVGFFPTLIEHYCGLGKRGGFIIRMEEGTYFGHVVEHVILEIQSLLGYEVYYGKTRLLEEPSLYNVIFEFVNESIAYECAKYAISIVDSIIRNESIDVNRIMGNLRKLKDQYELGPSSRAIYDEAVKRGIPVRRLGNGSILQLGYGKYSKLVQAALTGSTSGIAIDIACDKQLTKQLLLENNIPVPEGNIAHTLEDAINIAKEIGYPVVLKPLDGNQGKGVVLNINSEMELQENYRIPAKINNSVIVEKFIYGNDYRVLVVNNKISAVAERKAPEVIGDGVHTIEQLVAMENKNELRGNDHERPLTKIKLDRICLQYLKKYQLTPQSVPALGQIVRLRENGNISTGGSARECTNEIHPDNINIAIQAAKIIGLDIAGIDITTKDISKPLSDTEGAIIEVNAVPGLRMHLKPTIGNPMNVASDIIDAMYPPGAPHSIPIVAITGTNGKTTTTRLISHTLSLAGHQVGMTTTSGIYINNECVLKGDNTGPLSAKNVLNSKDVDIAVFEVARGGIVKRGLGYDLADVGVVINIGDDHIGLDGVETVEDLAFAKSLVIEAVKPDGYSVLNADDQMFDYFLSRARGNIIVFSRNCQSHILNNHIGEGKIAICTENNSIYIYRNGEKLRLMEISKIPITFDGALECNIENVLAATGVLLGLKTPIADIRKGLSTFLPDVAMNPGRFNIFHVGNVQVMLDYGHNIGGYEEVGKFIKHLKVPKAIGIIGVPGDRTDEQIANIGVKSAEIFSKIYVKEDKELRGRKYGEVADILYQAIASTNYHPNNVQVVHCELEALKTAISEAEHGDFITLFYEEITPALDAIKEFQETVTNIDYLVGYQDPVDDKTALGMRVP